MNKKNMAGFTLVEIMIVVAIIGLLGLVAVPSLVKARTISHENVCHQQPSSDGWRDSDSDRS